MKVQHVKAGNALIEFSGHELVILNNALNEAREALDQAEFSTRMGAELKEVEDLLHQIGELIDSVKKVK